MLPSFCTIPKKIHRGFWWQNPKLAVPTDKRDIPGFARSDVFLAEAHFLTECASPHGAAFYADESKKAALPTQCCNFHLLTFMHSDDRFSFWHLFFISDLYKTVSVKIFGFLLRRITVDAAQFGHRYGFYRFRLKCCGRCRSIHPSLFWRSRTPDEKLWVQKNCWYSALLSFQISCDGRSEYRVSVSLYIGLASYLFLSVPLRYGADSAPGAFLPLYVYIIADVLDNVNIFYKHF